MYPSAQYADGVPPYVHDVSTLMGYRPTYTALVYGPSTRPWCTALVHGPSTRPSGSCTRPSGSCTRPPGLPYSTLASRTAL